MEITITLNTDNPQDLEELRGISDKLSVPQNSLNIPINPAVEKDPVTETQKSETTSAKETKAEAPKAEEPTDSEITEEQIRTAFIELRNAKGDQTAKALVKEYGATKVSELPKDKYQEIFTRIAEELD